jgi:hypothetical protein
MRKINHGLSVEAQVVDEIIRSSMRNSLNELEHVENFPIFYCLDLRKCQRLARGEFIHEIAFRNVSRRREAGSRNLPKGTVEKIERQLNLQTTTHVSDLNFQVFFPYKEIPHLYI